MAATSNMFMYSLTLVPPSAVTHMIAGRFVGNSRTQLLLAQGSRLTLGRIERVSAQWQTILTQDCFGVIRHLQAFRLAGSSKDFIIVGSDSGRIVILEYIPEQNIFKKVHSETYGKSGVRRVIPGQYLASDPKGRAVMIASVEKNKLVYVLNRNAENDLTISSPLEAHKHFAVVYDLVGVDVGYENPIFAALEVDYEESDQDPTDEAYSGIEKQLIYYQLDLGLNHVVRKWTDTVDRTAHKLFPVPGGGDGPGGVLVCGEESISYQDMDQETLRVPIPRRKGAMENPERKRCITAGALYRSRANHFFMLQTEDGDLFKVVVEFEVPEGSTKMIATNLTLKPFGTVPVASHLTILSEGWLYVATESGDHMIYAFESRGDDDERPFFTSEANSSDPTEPMEPVFFDPRDDPEYLLFYKSFLAAQPVTGCRIMDLVGDDTPQIYSTHGSGARSTFRTIRHGLEVTDVAASPLPSHPSAVYTTKSNTSDQYDRFIVLSYPDSSFVLSISDGNVEQASDTGLITTASTIAVQALEDGILQVHPRGIRQIRSRSKDEEWNAPPHRTIVAASTNEQQVAVALSSGELVYFEIDAQGVLTEYEERPQFSETITSLSLGDIPEGRLRSSFLAIGYEDSTVRILSLDPDSLLESKSIQAVSAAPHSLRFLSMPDPDAGGSTLYLHIGLRSGVLLRTVLDEVTGDLIDTRTRVIGARPVSLCRVIVAGTPAILALTTRAWLGYSDPNTHVFMLTPIYTDVLDSGCSFSSGQCEDGIVGITSDGLRIFSIDKIDENLIKESIPLMYTPKSFVRHPDFPIFYVGESEMNTLAASTRNQLLADQMDTNTNGEFREPDHQYETYGYPRGENHWASCIQVVDPIDQKTVLETIELEQNEAVTSMALCSFISQDDEAFLVVGTGQDMRILPKSHKAGFLHVYRFPKETDGQSLEFVHKTQIEEPPHALIPFQGRLLAGIGKMLRIYDLGMKQLLRKAQHPNVVPTCIVGLETQGSRIVCADVSDSVSYVAYRQEDGKFLPFCDDTVKRWTTCSTMLDYDTSAGGDKFGNLWIVRCPTKVSQAADEDNGVQLLHEKGYLLGSANRMELMAHFYVQDVPMSIQRVLLVPGGREILCWAGLQGTIGILVPFVAREDVDFFQKLEQEMRQADPPLAGRDHLMYRGYYVPVKGTIDGDLVERFSKLKRDVKERIAQELDRTVRDVEKRIQDMRYRVAF